MRSPGLKVSPARFVAWGTSSSTLGLGREGRDGLSDEEKGWGRRLGLSRVDGFDKFLESEDSSGDFDSVWESELEIASESVWGSVLASDCLMSSGLGLFGLTTARILFELVINLRGNLAAERLYRVLNYIYYKLGLRVDDKIFRACHLLC